MHHIVPKAPGVADPLHPRVPGSVRVPKPAAAHPAHPCDTSKASLACPHSGQPCPALTALFGPLAPPEAEARAWLSGLAPCTHCRVSFEAGHAALRHLRLGQREREILLAAEAGGPLCLTEPGMTRSLSAARRRAALSLGKAGLVAPCAGGSVTPAAGPPRATVELTLLGRFVLAAYGRFLKGGKPVRWTRPARGATLPGRDPSELLGETLARTEAALRCSLVELKGVLVAAISGRLKDAGQLDAVTRHLERKATLLKAVLTRARPTQEMSDDAPGIHAPALERRPADPIFRS